MVCTLTFWMGLKGCFNHWKEGHESLGTKTIYEKLDQQGVLVSIHAHDNNNNNRSLFV